MGKKSDLIQYIRVQWYNKWMIHYNPLGWANTNSNIESFNATINRDFFQRERLSVFGVVLTIEEMIIYYSKNKILVDRVKMS